MKTKYAILTGLAMFALNAAFGQVEFDDMYFNSKDRAKLNAAQQEVLAKQYKQEDVMAVKVSPINPTDSYSGRSINPEYTNRLKTNPNLSANEGQYFISGYQPLNVNQSLSSNTCNCGTNNFNSPYNNYGMNPYSYGMSPYSGYGMNMYGMNSGFGSPYNSFYSPWGMGSGFYQPGWSSMLGYSFGGMNSGWFGGMNYGFGNSWGNPWNYGYGGSSFYNNYGMPYGGYGSNYYGNVIVNGGDYSNTVTHGKRTSRSSDIDNVIDRSRPETGYTRNGRTVSNGRSRSEDQTQYYDRAWKRDPDKNPSRSSWNDYSSSNNNGSRSSWNDNSSGRQYSSDSGNSRSSFNSGSTSAGSSRSSAGSHSRGRD